MIQQSDDAHKKQNISAGITMYVYYKTLTALNFSPNNLKHRKLQKLKKVGFHFHKLLLFSINFYIRNHCS